MKSPSPNRHGKEVVVMTDLITFIMSVAASVTAYYICKWLDRHL